jgi:phenylalanyl-tRNA synthetase beta chain
MLDMIAWNLNRGTTDVQLFEVGHVFTSQANQVQERGTLSLGATGNVFPGSPETRPRAVSFYDIKGVLEDLLKRFAIGSLQLDTKAADYYHPGRCARLLVDGAVLAQLGQLHPAIGEERKLRQEVYLAEVFLDRLFERELREPRYQRLSRFPAVERDFSFIIDDGVPYERLSTAIMSLRIAELRSLSPKEVYRGGSVTAGKYSLLLSAFFQSAERTLREDEVALWSSQIIRAVEALGGVLRAQ